MKTNQPLLQRRPPIEPLESRIALSTIIWGNRGQASDNFDAAFGAGAPAQAARAVIDAAIDAWNRVVTNFNHSAGIGSPDLVETISMNLGNAGFGASTSTTIGADGKPTAGSVTINLGDSNADNISDWWVDPTPNDNSEFAGAIENAFTALAQAGSPAAGRFDLFSVALAEITHNMGIANSGAATARYNTGGFYTNTGVADDAEGGGIGNFWLFQGPNVNSLMTNNNGGAGGSAVAFPLHTAGPRPNNAPVVFNGVTVYGVDDNGNASGAASERTLVSNKTALILKDAYDYDITMPETFGSFYSVLNETTGVLTVRGGSDNTIINNVNQGADNDNITITRSGNSIVVSVDVQHDVPGTGTGKTVNDTQDAFVTVFDAGKVTSLVVNAGAGDDFISIAPDVGLPATIDPGTGNDVVHTGTGAATVASVAGDGNDLVDFSGNPVGITFTVQGGDSIIGTKFNDTVIVDSTAGLIASPISFDGGAGFNTLTLQQVGGPTHASDVYSVGPNPGEGTSDISDGGTHQVVSFQHLAPVVDTVPAATLTVNGSAADNAFTYSQGSSAARGLVAIDNFETIEFSNKTELTLSGGGGSDTISSNNPSTPTGLTGITVDGGDPTGSDTLIISGTAGADTITFTGIDANSGDVAGLVLPIHYTAAEHVVLDGQSGDDTFGLDAAAGSVSLRGGAGADRVDFSASATGVVFDLDLVGIAQRVSTSDAQVTILDRMENFSGSPQDDILRVTASTFARDVFGDTPSLAPGDRLIIDGHGAVVALQKTDPNTGTVKIKGYADITFDEFESFSITNSPAGPGGFGNPGANSGAFNAPDAYSLTKFTSGGKPAPGKGPTAVATGDFNGDGFLDIVSANAKSGNISVLLNQGDGTFFDPINIKTGGSAPQDLVIGQFDAGAGLDVVVTNTGSKNLTLFSGNGAGGFAAPTLIPVAAQPYAITTDDLNADGNADIVITHLGKKQVGVLLGTGAGLGAETLFNSGGVKPVDVATGDFDNDGNLDVVTANNSSNSVSLLKGNGAGALAAPVFLKVGVAPTGVAVGDYDLDGVPDVAVSHFVSRFVSLLLTQNAGAPVFKPELRVVLTGYRAPTAIVAGDLDGDGLLDLGLSDSRGSNFTVLLGAGPGTFTQPYEFNLGKFASLPKIGGAALADLNGDGLLDIVTSITGNDDLRVLLRHT